MKHILLSSLAAFGFLSVSAAAQDIPKPLDFGPKEALSIVTANGSHDFMVEIADDIDEQIRGLMFRENLPLNEGMLFEYEKPSTLSIWMKNTPLPLDILFVRSNGKILKIEHSATPYSMRSISSEAVVSAVLELPGGRTKDLGIAPGDVVKHPFFKNMGEESK